MESTTYRRPTREEFAAGIKEQDRFHSCALCGEPIPAEDFEPAYVAFGRETMARYCHSACWQEAAKVGHTLQTIPSVWLVKAEYSNSGTKPTFFNHSIPQPCENSSEPPSFSPPSSREQSPTPARRNRLSRLLAPVSPAIRATLLAGISNNKRYAGFLLLALAPVAEVAFRFFDPKAGNPTDYWNLHYYLYSAGPHISGLLIVTGFFLLVHEKFRNWAILPGAYKFAKIIWLAFVSSNQQLHSFIPWGFLLMGLTASLIWFMSFDYLMSLHFHKREGIIARIIGIINAPGISDHDKVQIARDEADHLKQFS